MGFLDALAVGLAPTLAVMVTYLLSKRDTKRAANGVARKAAVTASTQTGKLDDIHTLVNSRLTEALDRVDLLEKRLGLEPGDPI